tara:strand:- start:7763 stop:7867 length:105 start_codon:yes stop_codon:yes gene_type:complete
MALLADSLLKMSFSAIFGSALAIVLLGLYAWPLV